MAFSPRSDAGRTTPLLGKLLRSDRCQRQDIRYQVPVHIDLSNTYRTDRDEARHLCPREQDPEGDKPPSKIAKSVRWMKSLLGCRPGKDKEQMDKETNEEEARGPATTAWTEEEHNLDPGLDLGSDSEREQSMEDIPPTPMEDGEYTRNQNWRGGSTHHQLTSSQWYGWCSSSSDSWES